MGVEVSRKFRKVLILINKTFPEEMVVNLPNRSNCLGNSLLKRFLRIKNGFVQAAFQKIIYFSFFILKKRNDFHNYSINKIKSF